MVLKDWSAEKEAKTCGTGAHILVPKKLKGRKFRIELLDEEEGDSE